MCPAYLRATGDAGRAAGRGIAAVIAIDGKTVRGAKNKNGMAPHLAAALAHGIGAVLGQVTVDENPMRSPSDLLRELHSGVTYY
jgi:hypothetical protein